MQISRVTRTKQDAQAMYNKISRWYDLLEGNWETKARIAGLDKLNVKPGDRILEIGVGTGHSLVALAQAAGQTGRVCGVDLAPRMIDISLARVRAMNLSERVILECGDAVHLNFERDFFNAIFMSFTLELFDTPELPEILAACRSVLQDDGRICIVSLSQAGQSTWVRRLYEWGHQHFPKFLDCRPIYVKKLLKEAEFHVLGADKMSIWGLPVEIVLAIKKSMDADQIQSRPRLT